MIDPENIINSYGADAVRFFILSDSPPEKMYNGQNRACFLHTNCAKILVLYQKIKEKIKKNNNNNEDVILKKFTNQLINKTTQNLNNFSYNVIIANSTKLITFN